MTNLDAADLRRRLLLGEWMQVGTMEILECEQGFAFWLDPSCHIANHVEEFVTLEQRCCPYLTFLVREDPAHDGPVVEIGGSEEAKRFVASHFGIRGHT